MPVQGSHGQIYLFIIVSDKGTLPCQAPREWFQHPARLEVLPAMSCLPDPTNSLPFSFPAFKQSPQGIPALGTGIKKRRHGEEEMYYVPVSVGELQRGQNSARDSGGTVPSARSTLGRGCRAGWGCTGSYRTAGALSRSKSIHGCTCPRDSGIPNSPQPQ